MHKTVQQGSELARVHCHVLPGDKLCNATYVTFYLSRVRLCRMPSGTEHAGYGTHVSMFVSAGQGK